ncbi:glycosyltransferase family 2 protein [Rubrolithibacter danxiaensis]|uniref:glycosyltransferase family 2 protein n=1 Tax=Rubrolithibacter danxiaensis TaxID=3390805 RepID=UPI003BF7FC44
MNKPVCIILLNWNGLEDTLNCIYSIKTHCRTNIYDIIVADNGSTDHSLYILKEQFPEFIFIDNKTNIGFAAGNNKALKYSITHGYSYSLLLNNDTIIEEDIISPLLSYLEGKHAIAAVQPLIYFLNDRNKIWNGGSYFNKFLGLATTNLSRSIKKIEATNVDWVTGCCFLVRNEALIKSGLFNERFFLYHEDVDLSFRLRLEGFQLHFIPWVKLYHKAGASGKKNSKKKEGPVAPIIHYFNTRNHIWILRRYINPIYFIFALPYQIVYYCSVLFYFLVRRRLKKAHYLMKGIKDGVLTPREQIWKTDNWELTGISNK